MRSRQSSILVLVALALLAGCAARTAGPSGAPAARDRVPGRYLVTAAPEAGPAAIRKAFRPWGVERVEDLGTHTWLVRIRHDPGPAAVAHGVRGIAGIRAVQPDYIYRATGSPARTIRTVPQSVRVLATASQCGGGNAPSASWIGSSQGLRTVWRRIHGTRRPPPVIDFRNDGVVLVSMGRRPTGGYRLALAGGFLPVNKGSATLRVNWITPSPGHVRARVISRPCLLLRVPRGGYREIRVVDRHGRVRATVRPH